MFKNWSWSDSWEIFQELFSLSSSSMKPNKILSDKSSPSLPEPAAYKQILPSETKLSPAQSMNDPIKRFSNVQSTSRKLWKAQVETSPLMILIWLVGKWDNERTRDGLRQTAQAEKIRFPSKTRNGNKHHELVFLDSLKHESGNGRNRKKSTPRRCLFQTACGHVWEKEKWFVRLTHSATISSAQEIEAQLWLSFFDFSFPSPTLEMDLKKISHCRATTFFKTTTSLLSVIKFSSLTRFVVVRVYASIS